jgi:hypothetical protein
MVVGESLEGTHADADSGMTAIAEGRLTDRPGVQGDVSGGESTSIV